MRRGISEKLPEETGFRVTQLLRYIDEIDRRQLWAKRGHPSMFDFCVRCWHMSESTAAKRIGAARAARRFPVILEMVARGEIHLSGLRLRALPRRGRQDAQAGAGRPLAGAAPQPGPAPGPGTAPKPEPEPEPVPAPQPEPRRGERAGAGSRGGSTHRSPDPKPLSPRRYKLEVTIGEDARAKLEQLQGLLGHQIPDGNPAAIVERAPGVLLDETLKKKAALTKKPRGGEATRKADSSERTIPARIRREVWKRDEGRCAFVAEDGRRCSTTRALEFAHAYPWAKTGARGELLGGATSRARCPSPRARAEPRRRAGSDRAKAS